MHEKYNTLTYNGYLYGVKGDCNIKAVRHILGNIELAAQHSLVGYEANARFSIIDGQLFINYFKAYVPNGNGKKLCNTEQITVSELDTFAFYEKTMVKHIVDEVICDGINRFFPYTGVIVAHQYYVDEVEWGSQTHIEKNVFCFHEGVLDVEGSIIQQSDETFMSQVRWDESKRVVATNTTDEKLTGRRWYFIDPIGSYLQNEHLFNVHINYCVSHQIKDEWLYEILSAKAPVLRCEIMQESEPGRGDFHRVSIDLVCDFIRLLDQRRLEDVYDHIQFDKYYDYPQKMMESLFVDSKLLKDECSEENVRKCIGILKLFLDKGLKVNNIERYITLLDNDSSHVKDKCVIAELLRSF